MKQMLLFGSPEAAEILERQKAEERYAVGDLTYDELIKMAAEVYAALKIRNGCPECGGYGGYVTHFDEEDAGKWEWCQCKVESDKIVDEYGRWFGMAAAKHLNVTYPEILQMEVDFVPLEFEILEKATTYLEPSDG